MEMEILSGLIEGSLQLEAGRDLWHKRLKANMEELGYMQCHRDHAVFWIGTQTNGNWDVCTFWVDNKTGIGYCQWLDHMQEMFLCKYGILGKGKLN